MCQTEHILRALSIEVCESFWLMENALPFRFPLGAPTFN